jgi:hypothetical protein
MDMLSRKSVLENFVSLPEPDLNITQSPMTMGTNVPHARRRMRKTSVGMHIFVDNRRALLNGFQGIEDGRRLLVFDFDAA